MGDNSTEVYLTSTTLAAVILMICWILYEHYWGKRWHRTILTKTDTLHETLTTVDKMINEHIIPTLSFIKS